MPWGDLQYENCPIPGMLKYVAPCGSIRCCWKNPCQRDPRQRTRYHLQPRLVTHTNAKGGNCMGLCSCLAPRSYALVSIVLLRVCSDLHGFFSLAREGY